MDFPHLCKGVPQGKHKKQNLCHSYTHIHLYDWYLKHVEMNIYTYIYIYIYMCIYIFIVFYTIPYINYIRRSWFQPAMAPRSRGPGDLAPLGRNREIGEGIPQVKIRRNSIFFTKFSKILYIIYYIIVCQCILYKYIIIVVLWMEWMECPLPCLITRGYLSQRTGQSQFSKTITGVGKCPILGILDITL